MRGCEAVVGVQINKTGDELIILKSGGGTEGHIMLLFLLCMFYIFRSERIPSESKIKTSNI